MRSRISILFWIFLFKMIHGEKDHNDVEIEVLPQPGMYFERLKDLKFIHSVWKIGIIMDLRFPTFNLTEYETYFQHLANYSLADNDLFHYQHMFLSLQSELRQAKGSMKNLKTLIEDLESTLTKQEQKVYDWESKELEYKTDRVGINLTRQSAVISSTLKSIDENVFDEDRDLQTNITLLFWYRANPTSPGQYDYEFLYEGTIRTMREKLNNLLKQIDLRIECVVYAKAGRISPFVLSSGRLKFILQKIQDLNYPYEVPVNKDIVRVDELSILATKYAYTNNQFQMEIAIPLVEPNTYPLYRLNLLPVPQMRGEEQAGFLYIEIKHPYLLIDSNGHKLMSEKDLEECREKETYHLCMRRSFMFDKEKRCEHQLLLTQNIASLYLCDIIFEKSKVTKFTKIRSTQSWIFIAPKPSNIFLRCDQSVEKRITISGIGHLYVRKPCVMRHGNRVIEVLPGAERNKSNIIFPDFNLKLENASNVFKDRRVTKIFDKLTKVGNKFPLWVLEQEISIRLLIYSNENLTFLIIMGLITLVSFLTVLTLMIISFWIIKWKKDKNIEHEDVPSIGIEKGDKDIQEHHQMI